MYLKKLKFGRSIVLLLSLVLVGCNCYYKNNPNYKEVQAISAEIEKDPNNYRLYSLRASYYANLANDINSSEMRSKSIADFLKALELNKENKDNYNANVYNDLAIFYYMDAKDYEKSLLYSSEAIKLGHNDYSIRHIRGSSLCRLNRYEEAFSDYDYLIKNNRKEYVEYPRFWWDIGFSYYYNKKYAEAEEYFEYLLKLNSKQPYIVFSTLAFIDLELKKYDKAEEYALKSLEVDKTQIHIYLLIVLIYKEKGDKVKAEKYMREGIRRGVDLKMIWEEKSFIDYFGKDKIQKMIDEEKK